jgi:hypothetical protein
MMLFERSRKGTRSCTHVLGKTVTQNLLDAQQIVELTGYGIVITSPHSLAKNVKLDSEGTLTLKGTFITAILQPSIEQCIIHSRLLTFYAERAF